MSRRIALQLLILVAANGICQAQAPASQQQVAFFESKIRPLLIKHCVACHGPKEQESDLRLDTPAGIAKGGASGPSIRPGQPDGSLLLTAVKQQGDLVMPPEGKLTVVEIRLLEQWIRDGAALPGNHVAPRQTPEIDWAEARRHWAFRPLDPGPLPSPTNQSWMQTPVDGYVLQQLEALQVKPSAPADAATLVRRIALNLTGLPPTPKQVAAYAGSPTPYRLAALIDEWLASPSYGERWGRHWLDVARYADSNGLDENIAHGNAWRYRDYVVASFNDDLPFDQFVIQQLAGDLLPHETDQQKQRHLVATGFMTLGPKVLAEVDEMKMEMDIIDEQLDTLGVSLLGLTLGCARCHDHKFDPITTKDYYALAGIFKSTRTMEHYTKIARWNEVKLPPTAQEAKRIVALEQDLQTQEVELKRWQALAAAKPAAAGESQEEAKAKVKSITASLKALKEKLANVSSAMSLGERAPTNLRVHIRGSHLTLGDEVPRRFPQVLQGDLTPVAGQSSGRLQLAQWMTGPQQHLLARVIANRVWRWHWGQGLSPTVDNFGRLGEPPSHPKLLDYLATELIRHNWSLKTLHRLILNSSAYQQASTHREDAAKVDPENRWLWRFNPRRLEAEALRDSMLYAAGSLDRSMGGSLLHVENRKFFFDHTSKDETNYSRTVRSIYLPVVRNNLFDAFMLFDYSNASVLQGNRVHSVTAPQSLFLLNSDIVDQSARALAGRTSHLSGSARVDLLFQSTFSRSATEREHAAAIHFVNTYAQASDDQRAWVAFAHALLVSNEFLYIR